MNVKEFIIELLKIASFDVIMGFILYVGYRYFDRKYNSDLRITVLEDYLKEQNQKINGSTNFWDSEK